MRKNRHRFSSDTHHGRASPRMAAESHETLVQLPLTPAWKLCARVLVILATLFSLSLLMFITSVSFVRWQNRPSWETVPGELLPRAFFEEIHRSRTPLPVGLFDAGGSDKVHAITSPYTLQQVKCATWITPNASLHLQDVDKKEVKRTKKCLSMLVFFIHGNAGAYEQFVRPACALQQEKVEMEVLQETHIQSDMYAVDFAEESNIHRGRIVSMQAAFLVEAVEEVLRQKGLPLNTSSYIPHTTQKNAQDDEENECANESVVIWFIGHSMGGVVARLAVEILRNVRFAPHIDGVLTLNTPHRQPPVLLDTPMYVLYAQLWHVWVTSAKAQPLLQQSSKEAEGGGGKAPHIRTLLLSLTSGFLDVEVEQRLVRLPTHPRGLDSHWDFRQAPPIDHVDVCGKPLSHNDILRDKCAIKYAMRLLMRETITRREGDGKHLDKANVPLSNLTEPEAIKGETRRKNVVLSGFTGQLARWAAWCVTRGAFPATVTALYISLTLTVIQQTALRLVRQIFGIEGPFYGNHYHQNYDPFCDRFLWCIACEVLSWCSSIHIVVITLVISLLGPLLPLHLHCWMYGETPGCVLPWIEENRVSSLVSLLTQCFLLMGPVLLGAWIAVGIMELLRYGLQWMSHATRPRNTIRRKRCVTGSIVIYLIIVGICEIAPISMSRRAMIWFGLVFSIPPITETRAPVLVYALLYALHMMPFFVFRNEWKTGSSEATVLVHSSSRIAELLLHVLIIVNLFFGGGNGWHEVWKRMPRFHFWFKWIVVIGAGAPLFSTLLLLAAVPIETFRVIWVLQWGFPAFAILVSTSPLSDQKRRERFASLGREHLQGEAGISSHLVTEELNDVKAII